MALNFVTLVLDYYDGQLSPVQKGSVTLTPNVTVLDAADHAVVAQAPVTVNLLANPLPSVRIIATDSTGLAPAGWGWLIQPLFPGAPDGRVYEVAFAAGATQYMSDLMPAPDAPSISTPIPVTGTPVAGQVITATGPYTADWETPSGGGGGGSGSYTYVPSTAGAPSGTPPPVAGTVPFVLDLASSQLWAYIGGQWKAVTLS